MPNLSTQLREACDEANGTYENGVCKSDDGGEMRVFGPSPANPMRPVGVAVEQGDVRASVTGVDKIRAYAHAPESEDSAMVIEAGERRGDNVQLWAGTRDMEIPEEHRRRG